VSKIHICWLNLIIIIFGWLLAELCFWQIYDIEKNRDNEVGSIQHTLLSSFHFLGLGLMMAGLMKAYGCGLEALKKKKA
jgi:hypothetical protein